MQVVFVSSECAPFAKIGGLGDVVGSLPKALEKLGVDSSIFIPRSKEVDQSGCQLQVVKKNISLNFMGKKEMIDIFRAYIAGSKVNVYFIDNKSFFKNLPLYQLKSNYQFAASMSVKFSFFSKAVLQALVSLKISPDIIHIHDYFGALITDLLKTDFKDYRIFKNTKTMLTIHRLASHAYFKEDLLRAMNGEMLSLPSVMIDKSDDNRLDLLVQGIINADMVTTVSPTYAKEIQTKKFGEGIDPILRQRKKIFGILNGIDVEKFNPETDRHIAVNYGLQVNKNQKLKAGVFKRGLAASWVNNGSKKTAISRKAMLWHKIRQAKAQNKLFLQKKLGLKASTQIPLIGMVGRLDSYQKGFDLLIKEHELASGIDRIVNLGFQLVILGTGQKSLEVLLRKKAETLNKSLSVSTKFDKVLARQIYAAADMFLMPSRFEPCGLVQLIAMRYGAVPLVRKTGGLADTVVQNKTGFMFSVYSQRAMLKAVKRARSVYDNKKKWQKIVLNCMSQDWSWHRSASEYLRLYVRLSGQL